MRPSAIPRIGRRIARFPSLRSAVMRALSFTAGLIGLVAISASAGEGVLVKAPSRTWEAEYVSDPGAFDESNQSVSITRQFKFYMADATIDPAHPQQIAPVADDNIREYL